MSHACLSWSVQKAIILLYEEPCLEAEWGACRGCSPKGMAEMCLEWVHEAGWSRPKAAWVHKIFSI